jgi:hypothetical protein
MVLCLLAPGLASCWYTKEANKSINKTTIQRTYVGKLLHKSSYNLRLNTCDKVKEGKQKIRFKEDKQMQTISVFPVCMMPEGK